MKDYKQGWISNRFKTEENREWHTTVQYEANKRCDDDRKAHVEKTYGLQVRHLTTSCVRVTDGNKRLDLYAYKYFKVDTGERGIKGNGDDEIIQEYFNIKPL